MTAALAPDLPMTVPADPVAEAPPARSWTAALPRPANLATAVGQLGEWLGHASLEPARVILRREVPPPVVTEDVLETASALGVGYAVAGAVQGGATGLLGGVLAAGRWAPIAGVATALGVDDLLATATCVRAVAHIGGRYGFAVRSDAERAAVLALVATSLGGRATAGDHRHLAALVVRRLSVHRGPTAIVRFLPAVGPVLDAVLGAVLGARLLARVVDDADRHYRARYLAERALAA